MKLPLPRSPSLLLSPITSLYLVLAAMVTINASHLKKHTTKPTLNEYTIYKQLNTQGNNGNHLFHVCISDWGRSISTYASIWPVRKTEFRDPNRQTYLPILPTSIFLFTSLQFSQSRKVERKPFSLFLPHPSTQSRGSYINLHQIFQVYSLLPNPSLLLPKYLMPSYLISTLKKYPKPFPFLLT